MKTTGVLVAAPCQRYVLDSELFPENLHKDLDRVILDRQSFFVLLRDAVTESDFDLYSHARWFRFLYLETSAEDEAFNIFLESMKKHADFQTNKFVGLLWLPDAQLPLSDLDMRLLEISKRDLRQLTVRGQHVHLQAVSVIFSLKINDCKSKSTNIKRDNQNVIAQIKRAVSESMEKQREFPVVTLSTAEYLEVMKTTSTSRWPEFSCAVCDVDALPQLPPLQPGFNNSYLNITEALLIVKDHILVKGYYQSLACKTPQILSGMVQNCKSKNRRKVQTTTVHVERQSRNGKSSNARRMVWIVRRNVLEHAFDHPKIMEDLMSQGTLRYLISVGGMGTTFTLRPRLQLPDLDSVEDTEISELGEEVVLMLLGDLHPYQFCHDALRQCAMTQMRTTENVDERTDNVDTVFRSVSGPAAHAALRSFLGLCLYIDTGGNDTIALGKKELHPITREIFGPPGISRHPLLTNAQAKLGIEFSHEQLRAVETFTQPCVWFKSTAGAGKTRILLAMLSWVVTNKPEVLSYVVLPSLIMAKDLFQQVVSLLGERKVIFLAVVDTKTQFEDYGQNFLEKIADEVLSIDITLLWKLDMCIEILYKAWIEFQDLSTSESIRLWLRWFLSQRQILVDVRVYASILQRQTEACSNLNVIISSVTNLVKIQALQSSWNSWLPQQRTTALWGDEIELTYWPHITAALSGIDMAILFGDPMQGKMSEPHSGGGPLRDAWRPQDVFLHSTKNTKVMREVNYMTNDNSATWMQKKTSTVDHHHDWETHRYGDKITDFLKDVFRGDVQKNLRPAKTAPKSILVGLRFPRLHWEYEDGEVARCQLLFASIAMLVASEMILYYERRQNMNMDRVILIIGCLWQPLNHLKAYLHYCLQGCIEDLYTLHGLRTPPDLFYFLDIDTWFTDRKLDFRVAQDAHGPTALVSISLLVASRETCNTWNGDILTEPWLFEMLSRGSHKAYIVMEDLRKHVVFGSNFKDELRDLDMSPGFPLGSTRGTSRLPCAQCVSSSHGRGLVRLFRAWKHLEKISPVKQYRSFNLFGEKGEQPTCDCIAEAAAVGKILEEGGRQHSFCLHIKPCFAKAIDWYQWMYGYWPERSHTQTQPQSAMQFLGLSNSLRKRCNIKAEAEESANRLKLWKEILSCKSLEAPGLSVHQGPTLQDYDLMFLGNSKDDPEDLMNRNNKELRKDIDDTELKSVFSVWEPFVLDAVTMHIHSMKTPAQEEGNELRHLDQILILMPVLFDMEPPNCDVHKLLWCLSHVIFKKFEKTEKGMALTKLGSLKLAWKHHKLQELEIGGWRIIVKQCRSNRPAISIVICEDDDKETELLHWYVAMSLRRDHKHQQMCLARVYDKTIAAVLLKTLKEYMHLSVATVTCDVADIDLNHTKKSWTEVAEKEDVEFDWADIHQKGNNDALRLLVSDATADEKININDANCASLAMLVKRLPEIAKLIPDTEIGLSSKSTLVHAANVFMKDWNSGKLLERKHGRDDKTLQMVTVNYRWAKMMCRTAPAIVHTTDSGGKLFVGTLDHRLSKEWLLQQSVAVTVNCNGKFQDGRESDTWTELSLPKNKHKEIYHFDWCARDEGSWRRMTWLLDNIQRALDRNTNVYIHCRDGQYKSPFLCYCFLRLSVGMNEETALHALGSRVSKGGRCLATLEHMDSYCLHRLDAELKTRDAHAYV